MKRSYCLILFLFLIIPFLAKSQLQTEFWSTTQFGGKGMGAIIKTDGNGNNLQLVHSFGENPGYMPVHTKLCTASNGKLYGLTHGKGLYDNGVLFEYDAPTNQYTVVYNFHETTGSCPDGSLIEYSNGKLYGMTHVGGSSGLGVLFEFDPATYTYTKKIDFTGTANGSEPWGSLVIATNGKLYGMTNRGGTNNYGVLFEYDPSSNTYTKKIDFAGATNGINPEGSLLNASNGKLYGMTMLGGTNNYGVIFEYDPVTSAFIKKIDFNYSNGSQPRGTLLQATNGKLYGLTSKGGTGNYGVLFEYIISTNVLTKKSDFAGTSNGNYPEGDLMQASNGNLYGLTSYGGSNNSGVLFEYNISANILANKYNLTGGTSSSAPLGSLIQNSNGDLYGLTSKGGSSGAGTLFKFSLSTSFFQKMIDLNNSINGVFPLGSLLKSSNNKLYGFTSWGGLYDYGTIYEYNPINNHYSVVFNFDDINYGSGPVGTLIESQNGILYGMAQDGGVNGDGVFFEFNPNTQVFTKRHDFNNIVSGRFPYSSLVEAPNGKIYGVTANGGTFDKGVLFEFDPQTNNLIKQVDFTGINGSNPRSFLVAGNGKLYGMTPYSNGNYGTIFEYDPSTTVLTKKHELLSIYEGTHPLGSLVLADNGNFYGMTSDGGFYDDGVIFEYNPTSNSYTVVFEFNGGINGSFPTGTLLKALNGKLYGLSTYGGTSDMGVIFEFDHSTYSFNKKTDFNAYNGHGPTHNQLIEICAVPSATSDASVLWACPGDNISVNLSVIGNGLTFQWQVDQGAGFSDLVNNLVYPGVTDDTLLVNGVSGTFDNLKYRCVINSTCPQTSIISDTIMLAIAGYNYTENHQICSGDSYFWQGNNYTAAGTYHSDFTSFVGCDSTYTLNLTVNPEYSFSENHSICNGSSFAWHGNIYSSSGTYYTNYNSHSGCDSTYILNLTVNANTGYSFIENQEVCDGNSYTWHGNTYNQSGVYIDNYTTLLGCDSTYFLNLQVNPVFSYLETHSICNGQTYAWHGQSLTTAGIFYDNHTSINGCDSLYTLTLNVNSVVWPGDVNNDSTVTADDLLALGLSYNETGFPRDSISNLWIGQCSQDWTGIQSNGKNMKFADCNGDGTVSFIDTVAINQNFSLGHMKLINMHKTGSDIFVVPSNNIVSPGQDIYFDINVGTTSAPVSDLYGLSFLMNTEPTTISTGTLNLSFSNSWLGAPGVNTIKLNKEDESSGDIVGAITGIDFIGRNGFGTVARLFYTINPAVASLDTITITLSNITANDPNGNEIVLNPISTSFVIDPFVGIENLEDNPQLNIYPNPSSGSFTLELGESASVEIYNAVGGLIFSEAFERGKHTLSLTVADGIYLLKALGNKDCRSARIVINN